MHMDRTQLFVFSLCSGINSLKKHGALGQNHAVLPTSSLASLEFQPQRELKLPRRATAGRGAIIDRSGNLAKTGA